MPRLMIASVLALMALTTVSAEAQWLNHPTPGIPRTADGKPNLSAPAPRTPDGKPDLSGLWATPCVNCSADQRLFFDLAKGLPPLQVQMTPWAAAIQQQRQRRQHVDDPFGYCLPPGVPRMYFVVGTFRIMASPTITAFLHETAVGLMFRQVFTDGRELPTVTEPTWLGYSVGRWEGDTFVIETTGFKDRGWLDTEVGRPHSDALRVTERLRRRDFGHIDLLITIDDAKAFLKPWTVTTVLTYQADTEILEAFCDNHDKTMEHRRNDPAPPEPPSPPLPSSPR
jgi:hypothetical protein